MHSLSQYIRLPLTGPKGAQRLIGTSILPQLQFLLLLSLVRQSPSLLSILNHKVYHLLNQLQLAPSHVFSFMLRPWYFV